MVYKYEPLPQDAHTRVLELQPALDPNMPLRGNFRCVNLDIDPFYDAISYTWGDPVFTEEIVIDEVFRLGITPNLRDALVRFRAPFETRSIWADAICINQENDKEKAKQISIMIDIFRCASSVLVWLGRFPEAARSMQTIALLSQKKTITASPSEQGEITMALDQIFSVPWFSRRWVIQEVVSNPNVTFFCDTMSLPWLRIVRLLKVAPEIRLSISVPHFRTLEELWNMTVFQVPPKRDMGILHLLTIFSESHCSDGRDRIYALAGLAKDVVFDEKDAGPDRIVIQIDYTKSEEQVLIDFALAVFRRENFLHNTLLIRETSSRSDGSNLNGQCSWATDWRLPILNNPFSQYIDIQLCTSEADINAVPMGHALYSGRFVGKIEDVSECFPTNADRSVTLAWVHSLFEYLKRGIVSRNQERQLEEVEGNVLWGEFMSTLTNEKWDCEVDTLESLDFDRLRRIMKGRRLFMFSSYAHFGSETLRWPIVGICSSHTSVGDVVLNHLQPDFPEGIVVRETGPRVCRPKDMPQVQWAKCWSERMRFHLIGEALIYNLSHYITNDPVGDWEGSHKEAAFFHII